MQWLLVFLIPLVGGSRLVPQDPSYVEPHGQEEVTVTTRPHIHHCRSPNMEDFTCWWQPLRNVSDAEDVSYVLTYSKDRGPKKECPNYVAGGPNSCHFDRSHTSIWKVYCMNVTAVTASRNYTSQEHCLDVAEIVQTEAPVNLTCTLTAAGGYELVHDVLLSWTYPVPADLQFGWITLVYELQYRRVTEPNNWKVKQPLRESHVELLGLPAGEYVFRVRCRSHNYGLWSKWSSALHVNIPARLPGGKLLVFILVTGVGVVALLAIAFGIIPQSKRIKAYFLPPIPKPRITGIDPFLLKRGHMEEINRHFSSFHGYRPPSYAEEVWDQVSADDGCPALRGDLAVQDYQMDAKRNALTAPPPDPTAAGALRQAMTQNLGSYTQSPGSYRSPLPDAYTPASLVPAPGSWAWPGIVSLPGTDYSVMGHAGQPAAPQLGGALATVAAGHSPQDLYTCVQLINDSGEVHLVPCLTPAPSHGQEAPPRCGAGTEGGDKEEEKKKQLADYLAWKNTANGTATAVADRGKAE
ncbi:prolactin receptor-like [Polymixia lowei]